MHKSEAKVAGGCYMWTCRASLGYLDLFRTPDMRRIIIVITILWMLIRCWAITALPLPPFDHPVLASLEFDCTVRNITNLDFSIYVSFCISAALEFPADMLSIVGLEVLGRRSATSYPKLSHNQMSNTFGNLKEEKITGIHFWFVSQ